MSEQTNKWWKSAVIYQIYPKVSRTATETESGI